MRLHLSIIPHIHQGTEYLFNHSTEVFDFHERKTTDAAIFFPADQRKFVSITDARLLAHILGKDHLAPFINCQYCLNTAPAKVTAGFARGFFFFSG